MNASSEWKIVIDRRRLTSGHRTVGEEEDRNNHDTETLSTDK